MMTNTDDLGWQGTYRAFRTVGDDERFQTAVLAKADQLGLHVEVHPNAHGAMTAWTVQTGTPATWLASDKLAAYVDGLSDALSGTYARATV